jgi:putative membrane protein
MSLFSKPEEDRIAAAIAEAERATSGEIVAVVAAESASYLHVPVMIAAVLALLVPWPLVYFTWWPVQWIYVAQLAVFLLVLLALLPRRIRFALVPRAVKHGRAHRRAVEQFLTQNLHTTEGRTGVLIFISVAERYAAVLADTRIDSRVPAGTWQAIVDELTARIGGGHAADGLIAAISSAGGLLAAHFPPGTADPDELPNHLIVLD